MMNQVYLVNSQITFKSKSMDTNSEIQKPAHSVSNSKDQTIDAIAEKRSVIPIAFAAIVVLFFFSFVNFKCNGTKVASVSGFNLVTGTHIKTPMSGLDDMSGYFNNGESSSRRETKGEKVPSNNWAILAFLSAIAGVAVFYKKVKKEALIGFVIGIVGSVSLLVLRWTVKSTVESEANGMVSIEVDFAFGYWMSLLMFIVGGGISYLRLKKPQEPETKPVVTINREADPV